MERISRSFQLVGQSYRILMKDKELMVLPLLSGLVIIGAVVGVGFGFGFTFDPERFQERGAGVYVPMFLMYVVTYTIGIFFQAAVIAGATERMRCLLYTSDAADERSSVDLGGRRIIKKKKI